MNAGFSRIMQFVAVVGAVLLTGFWLLIPAITFPWIMALGSASSRQVSITVFTLAGVSFASALLASGQFATSRARRWVGATLIVSHVLAATFIYGPSELPADDLSVCVMAQAAGVAVIILGMKYGLPNSDEKPCEE